MNFFTKALEIPFFILYSLKALSAPTGNGDTSVLGKNASTNGTYLVDDQILWAGHYLTPTDAGDRRLRFYLRIVDLPDATLDIDGKTLGLAGKETLDRFGNSLAPILEVVNLSEGGRGLVLTAGSARISTGDSDAVMLVTRNGDRIRSRSAASFDVVNDPNCNSIRIGNIVGEIDAPAALIGTTPQSCPPDSIMPSLEQNLFQLSDGILSCNSITAFVRPRGTWNDFDLNVSVVIDPQTEHSYLLALVPQGNNEWTWFQNTADYGWTDLSRGLHAWDAGRRTILEHVDVSGLVGTEFYIGYGASPEEMLAAKRYCGAFRITPKTQ